jgi:hypothetical protein
VKPASFLYKSTGDKNVTSGMTKMSPQERAKALLHGRPMNVEALWGKVPLLSVVDDNLSHFAFRVLALFSVKPLSGDVIELSHREIAEAMTCSERQAIRGVAELERAQYLEVSRRHNMRNSYRMNLALEAKARAAAPAPEEVVQAVLPRVPDAAVKCGRCRKPCRKVGKAGWCRSCVETSELAARVESARAKVGRDATPEQLAAHLKNARLALRIRRLLEAAERAA